MPFGGVVFRNKKQKSPSNFPSRLLPYLRRGFHVVMGALALRNGSVYTLERSASTLRWGRRGGGGSCGGSLV